MVEMDESEHTEPQFGPNLRGNGEVSWVCGDCGRGNSRNIEHPPRKNGERAFRCGWCGASIPDPKEGM